VLHQKCRGKVEVRSTFAQQLGYVADVHGGSHGGTLLERGKMGHEAKNVLFCLKNIGLAKEPDHTPALFLKQNDIVVD
jgi:hypothetical protein